MSFLRRHELESSTYLRHQRTGTGDVFMAINSISCITISAMTALTGDHMAHPDF